jgi:protein SCO1/2
LRNQILVGGGLQPAAQSAGLKPCSYVCATAVALVALVSLTIPAACTRAEPPRQYPITGQILAVHPERQEVTIKHDDIPQFMPAMTMPYPVATRELIDARVPGELISGTLEVVNSTGRLIAITRTGMAPLPVTADGAPAGASLLAEGDEVPDAAFVDQADRRRSFAEWSGQVTMVTFMYTNCPLPNFCPLMDQNFSTIQRAAAEDAALAGRVRLVSISLDPERDTPAVLTAHAARRRADPAVWTFLTGDRVTIDRFAARFGVAAMRDAAPAEITHNLRTALVGPDRRIVKLYSGSDWTPGTALADLRAALTRP